MPDDSAAAGTGGVDDLDGKALRDALCDNAAGGLAMARDRYVLAYRWCVTHPPVDQYDVATLGDAGLPGLRECDTRVGGEGTPGISSIAVTEYAALAGISPGAGIRVLSDTLDLHHRLPSLWTEVDELRVPAWKAARIAELTHGLSADAATWIDQRLADTGRYGWTAIEAAIKQATALFHPDVSITATAWIWPSSTTWSATRPRNSSPWVITPRSGSAKPGRWV